ncbi:MAG: hypothetical protein Q9212_005784 [Teloschistes hypoglaucus]
MARSKEEWNSGAVGERVERIAGGEGSELVAGAARSELMAAGEESGRVAGGEGGGDPEIGEGGDGITSCGISFVGSVMVGSDIVVCQRSFLD